MSAPRQLSVLSAAAPVWAFAAALVLAGCSGVSAPDLFVVQRSGSTPQAQLTLLVNEEGGVSCNGRAMRQKLADPQIIKAREIQEDLQKPSSSHLSLPPRTGSVLHYYVRDESGTVRFSDNSAGQPSVLQKLQLFVLQTGQEICHREE
ncbi:MAG TPA: hypothetical protein VGX72_07895 [Solirubrobacteraceae bacterium]|nr:hypothetical protein [Solirubrobacteraceae bacterium]